MRASQGSVEASNNTGAIVARLQMGSIRISGQKGDVDAETQMGNIRLNNPESLSERAVSQTGSVKGMQQRGPASASADCRKPLRNLGNKGPFNF